MKRLFGILLILIGYASFSQETTDIEEVCLTQSEFKLYNLINKLRIENNEEIIPVSRSLTFVAKTHINDLNSNHPDTSVCNFHSWSDKGEWTPCCHNKYLPKTECMTSKPGELTDYNYDGYELTFWDSEMALPDSIIDLWSNFETSRNMILELEQWEDIEWDAIGLAISGKYALVWFGSREDKAVPVKLCSSGLEITGMEALNETSKISDARILFLPKTNRYHVITGSYSNTADAESAIKRLWENGYSEAGIVRGNQNFRISILNFPTLQEAKNERDKLGNQYKNAWILKY